MSDKYILGSGLIALLCRKILGDSYKLLPIGPSRFYSSGIPAWADDYVIKGNETDEIIKDWNLKKLPLLFKRPISIAGQLLYTANDAFMGSYLNKVNLPDNPINIKCFSTTFSVYSFSCLQLWDYLLKDYINEIKKFHDEIGIVDIDNIKDHEIILKTKTGHMTIEYDKLISTIPLNILQTKMGMQPVESFDTYHYYIQDDGINLEGANQVLVADEAIPFHKCTKITGNRYVFEFIGNYREDMYEVLVPILGDKFEIINTKCITNGHINQSGEKWNNSDIVLVGSLAQADPLMDIGSCIKRIYNLIKNEKT